MDVIEAAKLLESIHVRADTPAKDIATAILVCAGDWDSGTRLNVLASFLERWKESIRVAEAERLKATLVEHFCTTSR